MERTHHPNPRYPRHDIVIDTAMTKNKAGKPYFRRRIITYEDGKIVHQSNWFTIHPKDPQSATSIR